MSGYEAFSWGWWGFVACLIPTLCLTFWAGVEWCRFHHKQRGVEVDRFTWRDILPMPPPPVTVPDHVPEEWTQEEPDPALDVYVVGPNGVLGPRKLADVRALIERGYVAEVQPGLFEVTDAGREYVAELRKHES